MHDNSKSCQPCGCDEGAGWVCAQHTKEAQMHFLDESAIPKVDFKFLPSPPERKQYPLASGCLDYFPDALMEVAYTSWIGNEQHNPGQPLHWDRDKSTDEPDALLRHLKDRGTLDSDGVRHSAKVAWRALAMLQKEIEAEWLT